MFSFNRQPKATPAPEKVERFDLGEGRPDVQPPAVLTRTAPYMGGMPLLAKRLPALGGANPPGLPPRDLAATYDEQLEVLMGEVSKAGSDALTAARAWLSAHQGEAMTAAIEAERAQVTARHDNGVSPLYEHMTNTTPLLFVEAVRAQARYEIADQKVREHGSTLTDNLDKASDEIAGELQQLFERARDRKDNRSYLAATDTAAEWCRVSSLHEWSLHTSQPFRARRPNSAPAHLGLLAWEAAQAVGIESGVVPLEALQFPGAPRPAEGVRPR